MAWWKSIILFLVVTSLPVAVRADGLFCELTVHIMPERKIVAGTARLRADSDRRVRIWTPHLSRIHIDGRPADEKSPDAFICRLRAGIPVDISYQKSIGDLSTGYIDSDNILLVDHWYPRPADAARYRLNVTLPDDFIPVSEGAVEADSCTSGMTTHRFHFPHPLDAVHLAASRRYVIRRETVGSIDVETYFFREDAALAETYLQHAKQAVEQYQNLLGPYPFKRFAVVETILPLGHALPGFTLLGQPVVRLPFIPETSLYHEVLHQWLGCAVRIDTVHGNWAEGLTTYLSDHLRAQQRNHASAFRKQIMIDHEAFVGSHRPLAVAEFKHGRNRAQQAVGYGRAAMVFHMLYNTCGETLFFDALRRFVDNHLFKAASWHDLQKAFEQSTGKKLFSFFAQWLDRPDIPRIAVQNAALQVEKGRFTLRFDLLQQERSFDLRLPVELHYGNRKEREIVETNRTKTSVAIPIEAAPTAVYIDAGYDVMRRLTEDERPPVLADVMAKDRLTVAAAPQDRPLYEKLVQALDGAAADFIPPHDVALNTLNKTDVLVTAFANPRMQHVFGRQAALGEGVRLRIFKNPFIDGSRVMLVHIHDVQALKSIEGKLKHYGKYSEIAFADGRNTIKRIEPAMDGLLVMQRPEATAVAPDQLPALRAILPQLARRRVVFVGEQHQQYAHHLNQLAVIRYFHTAGIPFGVGMEMFQAPRQAAIDDFMCDRIDERTFLKRSGYFVDWGYDYNLYKPIIDFIKQHRIPLVALNIDGDITRKTARSGLESLDADQRRSLPEGMDFSDPAYIEDMRQVYALHGAQKELDTFAYFLQAQVLWDESMAAAAHRFLAAYPTHHLIVLAGNGHLRHRYGIPRRLSRRMAVSSVVVLQDAPLAPGIADYVLNTTPIHGVGAPKLGISVDPSPRGLFVRSVMKSGPAGNGGLREGDQIQAVDGRPVADLADLKTALFFAEPDRTVVLRIQRNGNVLEKSIQLTWDESSH